MAKKTQALTPIASEKFTANERLYVSEDGKSLVKEGDPRAAFLFTTPGKTVSKEDAVKFGLIDEDTKAVKAPANKAKAEPENKSDGPTEDKGTSEEEG